MRFTNTTVVASTKGQIAIEKMNQTVVDDSRACSGSINELFRIFIATGEDLDFCIVFSERTGEQFLSHSRHIAISVLPYLSTYIHSQRLFLSIDKVNRFVDGFICHYGQ